MRIATGGSTHSHRPGQWVSMTGNHSVRPVATGGESTTGQTPALWRRSPITARTLGQDDDASIQPARSR
jgi:hypothetical protein